MPIRVWIKNAGYAPLYNERPVYIVLKNAEHTYSLLLTADPRRWLPTTPVYISESPDVPAEAAEGTYHLYLHMPDKYSSIAADPRYAVRLANVGIWDEQTGLNDLGADITVSHSAPLEPAELPDIDNAVSDIRDDSSSPNKIILDGILCILHNGSTYTTDGQRIK